MSPLNSNDSQNPNSNSNVDPWTVIRHFASVHAGSIVNLTKISNGRCLRPVVKHEIFQFILSCCTLPVISMHKPLERPPLFDCLPLAGFLLGPGSKKTGCTRRLGFGLIRFTSLPPSSSGRSILFSDLSSSTSSWFKRTCTALQVMGGKHISIGKALPTYNSQIKSTRQRTIQKKWKNQWLNSWTEDP